MQLPCPLFLNPLSWLCQEPMHYPRLVNQGLGGHGAWEVPRKGLVPRYNFWRVPGNLFPAAKQQDLMMLDGFMMYLLSADGNILNQEHTKVYQDMNHPLCHYFISSSHNTYLTDNQIGGPSSTEAYIR